MNIKKDNFFGYLFILPFLILFFSFLIYLFGKLFYMSLFEWNLMAVAMNPDNAIYVGFENFYYLLAGEGIWFNFFVFFTPIKILTFIILTVFLYFLYTREILKHNFGLIFFFIYAYVVYFVHGIQPTEDAYWEDDVFWKSIRNTMVMDFFSAYSITFIALLIAITTNHTGKIYIFIRTLFWSTGGVGVVALALIFSQVFSGYSGPLAHMQSTFNLEPFSLLISSNGARFIIIFATVWWAISIPIMLFLAALQQIPEERYEAARIDGVTNSQMFFYITLPGIGRMFLLVSILQIISHWQIFGQVNLMTNGGPADGTRTVVLMAFDYAFRDMEMGQGAAVSVILFLIMSIFTFIQFKTFRENE